MKPFKDGSLLRRSENGNYSLYLSSESFSFIALGGDGAETPVKIKLTGVQFFQAAILEAMGIAVFERDAEGNIVNAQALVQEDTDLNQKLKALGLEEMGIYVKETTEADPNWTPEVRQLRLKRYPAQHPLAGQVITTEDGEPIYRSSFIARVSSGEHTRIQGRILSEEEIAAAVAKKQSGSEDPPQKEEAGTKPGG